MSLAADGVLRWNGVIVSDATLENYLDQIGKMDPVPFILFEIKARASCLRVREIREIMTRAPICREGLCSEGRAGTRWPYASMLPLVQR